MIVTSGLSQSKQLLGWVPSKLSSPLNSEVLLTRQQHADLTSIAQSRSLPAGYVFRAN